MTDNTQKTAKEQKAEKQTFQTEQSNLAQTFEVSRKANVETTKKGKLTIVNALAVDA